MHCLEIIDLRDVAVRLQKGVPLEITRAQLGGDAVVLRAANNHVVERIEGDAGELRIGEVAVGRRPRSRAGSRTAAHVDAAVVGLDEVARR